MKILMVLMGLEVGGAETHVVELSKELSSRGHEIVVASNSGVYTAEIKAAGIRHITLPLNSRSAVKMHKSYRGLYREIKSGNYDMVHAHARIPGFICGLINKRLKFRFITTTHWVFQTGPLLNLMTNWGESTIAVSEDIKKYLIKNYKMNPDLISLTINGIDTVKFSADTLPGGVPTEFGMRPNALRAVYVSRMDTDRSAAAFNLINITPSLVERYPNFELVIVGGGNDFERLKTHAEQCNEKLGSQAVIITDGRIDINQFVATADVFIGVSRAALEAMAAAKPVIIAGNEGYIGLFDESKLQVGIDTNFCCRGCEMTDDRLIYRDITAILDADPQRRRELGEYNRSIILDRYSGKKMADDCEAAYNKLLSVLPIKNNTLKRPLDILISGYYGYKNTGDDSLLDAIISNLRAVKPDISICVLSSNPYETTSVYGVDSLNRFNFLGILRAMRKTKLLISGGGSLLQDVTSTKSLLYYLSVIRLAKAHGMKTMIYASGIGPISGKRNRKITGKTLNQADFITLREPASHEEIKLLGITKPRAEVSADPAFAIVKANDAEIADAMNDIGLTQNEQFVIVSVRPWKKADPNFPAKLAEACDYISEKHQLTVVFLPMQYGVDLDACVSIANKMKSKYKIIDKVYSASVLIGIIEKSHAVIGMRLHTLIYAASACVPVFGLSYDPKVDAMLTYIGQGYRANVSEISTEEITRGIDDIFTNHTALKTALEEKTSSMKARTMKDAKVAVELILPR